MPSLHHQKHHKSNRDDSLPAQALLPISLISLVGMTCYEFIKLTFALNLTVWKLDLGAIVFGSLAITFLAFFFLSRKRFASESATAELSGKQLAQTNETPNHAPLLGDAATNDVYYRQLFELNPQPMWIYDLATHEFLAVNESAVRHYGYSPEEFAAMKVRDICLSNVSGTAPATIKSISPGYLTPRVWIHRKKNGMLIDVTVSSRTFEFKGRQSALVLMHDITEVKRIERILIQSETELRVMFGAMNDIVLTFDIHGKLLKVAPTNFKSRDNSSEKALSELVGKKLHEVFPSPQADFMLSNIRLALEQNEVQNVEYKLQLGSDRPIWSESRIAPMSSDTVIWISHDITKLKEAQEKLNTQQELLVNVINTIPSLIFVKNEKGVFQLANKAVAEAYGTTVEDLVGKTDANFNPNIEECEFYLQKDLELIQTGRELFIPAEKISDKNGNLRWLQTVKRPFISPGSNVRQVLGICTDITERKEIEEQLRQSEESYRELFENATDIVYTVDLNGNFTSLNKAGERLVGYLSEDLKEVSFRRIIPAEYWEIIQQNLQKKISGEVSSAIYEIEIIAKDGARIPLETSTRLIKVDDQPIGIQGISRDISERKKFERQIRESEKKFHDILGSMNEIVWSVAFKDSAIIYVSPAVEAVYGCTVAEFWQDPKLWLRVVYPNDSHLAHSFIEKLRRNGEASTEYRIVRPDNEMRWVHIRAGIFNDLDGNPARIDGITIDITERKELEEQLRQAQKLESVGQLASGIAHEINTPLQYVGDNTLFLKDAFGGLIENLEKFAEMFRAYKVGTVDSNLLDEVERTMQTTDIEYLIEEIPNALGQTIDGIERVTLIVQSMKDFAHPGSNEMTAVDFNKSIETTINVARNEWKYVAELETDFDKSLPPVICMSSEINQAILNLIINAVHTISDVVGDGSAGKGKITIQTRRDGESVVIRVSDTGKGIPEDIREKVLDPFFTTKEVGRGTGQGLSISHRVITKHGGNLTFETEIGKGTTFIIRLPIDGSDLNFQAPATIEFHHENTH